MRLEFLLDFIGMEISINIVRYIFVIVSFEKNLDIRCECFDLFVYI